VLATDALGPRLGDGRSDRMRSVEQRLRLLDEDEVREHERNEARIEHERQVHAPEVVTERQG
jgi:hypothetical protein